MDSFILGTNYWASHAGTDMWRNWDEEVVKSDLELLRQNGIEYLRVFPNWRDFQPVMPAYTGSHRLKEYRMMDDTLPENPGYLSPVMLERFHIFCGIAQEKGLKLIVGLITGWMSGRLFLPPVLQDKNVFTDSVALYFQQMYVREMVLSLKNEAAIYAWDLGNECNCMDTISCREEACSWTAVISNAIRACDNTRPVVSGMHSLELEGLWNIQDQGEFTDILTTHPYPLWVEHGSFAPVPDFRTLLFPTAQTQYYSAVGGKPCLVEETGTMGPMICSEENAAGFMRVNLWSNWAHGACGLMWWCANEQSHLTTAPYDWNMCERELGMLDSKMRPKPMLLEMKRFREELVGLDINLPEKETDGVCILSQGQDHWGIAYMSYLLAKQAGLTLTFDYCGQELPDSGLYFLPSVKMSVMNKRNYDVLKRKVYEGAILYISSNNGIFSEFEELTGLRVEFSCVSPDQGVAEVEGEKLLYRRPFRRELKAVRAEILLWDGSGRPLYSVSDYGKGRVYFLNFPVEEMLLAEDGGFDRSYFKLYELVAENILKSREIRKRNPYVGMTVHRRKEKDYVVLINYTDRVQETGFEIGEQYGSRQVLYGNSERIEPFGAAVVCLSKGKRSDQSSLFRDSSL